MQWFSLWYTNNDFSLESPSAFLYSSRMSLSFDGWRAYLSMCETWSSLFFSINECRGQKTFLKEIFVVTICDFLGTVAPAACLKIARNIVAALWSVMAYSPMNQTVCRLPWFFKWSSQPEPVLKDPWPRMDSACRDLSKQSVHSAWQEYTKGSHYGFALQSTK